MERHELEELHYIAPIANLESIISRGLLSHRRVSRLAAHQSIALADVQAKRAAKRVPGGRPLHEYVNLYICARNPMLYKRLAQRQNICVLRVSPAVLDIDDVVITDMNAASDYVRFFPAPDGLNAVERDRVFAEYWAHPGDPFEYFRHSAEKCAEVLVPDRVDASNIRGAYVCNADVRETIDGIGVDIDVEVNRPIFFNQA